MGTIFFLICANLVLLGLLYIYSKGDKATILFCIANIILVDVVLAIVNVAALKLPLEVAVHPTLHFNSIIVTMWALRHVLDKMSNGHGYKKELNVILTILVVLVSTTLIFTRI